MKVKFLKTGESVEVNASYAERLVEQGQAVVVAEKAPKKKAEEPAKEKGE